MQYTPTWKATKLKYLAIEEGDKYEEERGRGPLHNPDGSPADATSLRSIFFVHAYPKVC